AGGSINPPLNKTTGLTDTQIHSNRQAAISAGQLAAPDAQRLYVVYVEPGVVVKLGRDTSQNSFLGYHGAFAGRTAGGQAADIRYAVLPYPGTTNPSPSAARLRSSSDDLNSASTPRTGEAVAG